MIAERTYAPARIARHLDEQVRARGLPCFPGCAVCHAFMELRPEEARPIILAAWERACARRARDIAAGEA